MERRAYHDCRFGATGGQFVRFLNLVRTFCLEVEERRCQESRRMGGTHTEESESFHARYVLILKFWIANWPALVANHK